ncbi:MAG: peptide chain release factor N(5)-glutamine methyltransferase [Eubacteriales bacterium]|nr:peptide chain release factor N(5)-glutamine methyltransferase [Eubacteriales bacterium]
MVSLWDAFVSARRSLAAMGVAEADLEARELAAYAAGLEARDTVGWKTTRLTPDAAHRLQAFLERRAKDEPLAYILGEWDFYGNRFAVRPGVLIPRGDTEWLCDAAVQAAREMDQPRVLDLCCGSGCIGISIALAVPEAQVTLLDCSETALDIATRNAASYQLKEPRLKILRGNALQPDSLDGILDIVVSNPPYITAQEMRELDRSVSAYEPHLALYGGVDGLDFYRAMAQAPAFCLAEGGRLFAECGWKQGRQVMDIFTAAGWHDVHLRRDLAGVPRILCAVK